MKTIIEYEVSDIDLSDNLYSLISTGILVGSLIITSAQRSKDTDSDTLLKEGVVNFLNLLNKHGYVIVKDEIP